MNSICIIAPHQDDEILSCYYVIRRALEAGDHVFVLFMTNGDFEGRGMARLRALESLKALKQLGLKEENINFLGYADTGMKEKESFLYRLYHAQNEMLLPTKYAIQTYHPLGGNTFHFTQFLQETLYTRLSLLNDLTLFFKLYLPNQIYCPSSFDRHGDHKGTYLFVQEVLYRMYREMEYQPALYTYLIHVDSLSLYWPSRSNPYYNKPFILDSAKWNERIHFTYHASACEKRKLISAFHSQAPEKCRKFLFAFAKEEEIFWKVPVGSPPAGQYHEIKNK